MVGKRAMEWIMAQGQAPHSVIIVKKRAKGGHGGHHGGAWKVAYADFVTAMMAFFLLMWLLNATTEEQRKGLADYFNPSIPISKVSGGGDGALNGSSILSEDTLIRNDIGSSDAYPTTAPETQPGGAADGAENGSLENLQEAIENAKENKETSRLAKHIQTSLTSRGLLIELVDVDDDPLFALGSARPSRVLNDLLFAVAPVLATVENKMSIEGHTDSLSFTSRKDYSNWELSSDRANAARRLLVQYGFPSEQVADVTAKANTQPLLPDGTAPQNRRIALTLLKGSAPARAQ